MATTCDLGHRLGLTVVAEGVEDDALRSRLLAHGVDLLQGYHLARPLPEPELLALVADSCRRPGAWWRDRAQRAGDTAQGTRL